MWNKPNDTGLVLKKIVTIFMVLDIAGAILTALYFLVNLEFESYGPELIIGDEIFSLVALIGGAVGFCLLAFLYGLAQMIDDVSVIRYHVELEYKETHKQPTANEKLAAKIKKEQPKPEETLRLTNIKKMGQCSLCNRHNVLVTKATYIADNEQLEFFVCNHCLEEEKAKN